MTATDLTAPLPPAAAAALLRLERALIATPVDARPAMSAADRAAHEAASYVRRPAVKPSGDVRQYGRAA